MFRPSGDAVLHFLMNETSYKKPEVSLEICQPCGALIRMTGSRNKNNRIIFFFSR